MQKLPFFRSYDTIEKRLVLRGATYLPEQLLEHSEEIEILDLGEGALTNLPDWLPRLKRLRVAFFSNNPFTLLPPILNECSALEVLGFKACRLEEIPESALPPHLRWLILTDNQLTTLPKSFGSLRRLQKLSLAGNRLRNLPAELSLCEKLQLLRLGANSFHEKPPEWIFHLPALAWYGDAGNPFSPPFRDYSSLPCFAESAIEYGPKIGGSPSSSIFRAKLRGCGQEVAIKKYHGQLTSDGYSQDDMRAYVAAGEHRNLIRVLGRLKQPGNTLVLSLVPPEYKTLGLPPDLSSCTRDRFHAGTRFALPFVSQVLKDIAAAVEHLHANSLTHGDIYAHNILSDDSGRSFLGDFGAASFCDPDSLQKRTRLDVRAFGFLIEDLLENIIEEGEALGIRRLREIQSCCVHPSISEVPAISEVRQLL